MTFTAAMVLGARASAARHGIVTIPTPAVR
jgi:hypothetical protein